MSLRQGNENKSQAYDLYQSSRLSDDVKSQKPDQAVKFLPPNPFLESRYMKHSR